MIGFPTDDDVDTPEFDVENLESERGGYELSPKGIAENNRRLVERQAVFRRAADAAADALAAFDEVSAIALFGSVARPLKKEIPRFKAYRRARIALWHECKDVDIAVWLNRLDRLRDMRRQVNRTLPAIFEETGTGVAHHQLDLFVLEPETDRYLGRMCWFKACPAGKRECQEPGCGATPFLRQHQGFHLRRDALAPENMVVLYDRTAGLRQRAVDLPCPLENSAG